MRDVDIDMTADAQTSLRALTINEIEPGLSRTRVREVTRDHIEAFGALSGDRNPVHFDDAFAADTVFKGVVAHGMLSATYFSGIIGEELPGPGAIYLGQTLKFRGPVRPGDTVRTTCTVRDVNYEKRRVTIACEAFVGDKIVLEGEALILAPAAAPEKAAV